MIEFPIQQLDHFWVHVSKPVFAISALVYPLLDTLRVFIIRALKGQSPFMADRNHIHHKLLDCGYSHIKTVIIIYLFSLLTIGASMLTYYFSVPTYSLLTVVGSGALFLIIVIQLNRAKSRKHKRTAQA
jgi:hypothetical protein